MWAGEEDVVCPPAADLDAMNIYEVLRIMPKLLGDEDARSPATDHLAARLLSCTLDDNETRAVLRVLCAHSPSGTALLELFLQLLQTLNSPVAVIEFMSATAVSATPSQLQPILDRYRELSNLDRRLLVPIIGSIGELQLNAEQKRSYEAIVRGALKYVDETDIPTVVQSLLSLACPSNSSGIVAAIREQASALPFSSAMLLVEPVVASLRCTPNMAKSFWSDLSGSGSSAVTGTVTQLDVLIVGQMLQIWSLKHDAANALLEAAEADASALQTMERTLCASQRETSATRKSVIAEAPHATISAFVRLAMQLALISGSSSGSRVGVGRKRLELKSIKLTAGLVSTIARAAFSHKNMRSHTLTVLLSACAHRGDGGPDARGGIGSCARLAARTVLELATRQGDDKEGYRHLVLHFLTQHGPSCDVTVMRLLSSAAVAMYDKISGGFEDILLLLQKLISSPQADYQRAGLILSEHLLRTGELDPNDSDMVLRGLRRMNFSPSWPHAQYLYRAVMHGAATFPPESLNSILEQHIRPPVLFGGAEAGLIKVDEEDSSQYVVNILNYVKSKPISKPKAAIGSSELLRCFLLLQGGEGSKLSSYTEIACNWFVEMPESLQVVMPEDLQMPEKLDLESLSWTMRMGDCCWFNWLIGIAFARTHAACGAPEDILPPVVRNRMSQAMRFAKVFFEVLKPFLLKFVKSSLKDHFESVGGVALQELLSLTPKNIGAPLGLLCKTLALSGSVPAANSTGPHARYLPALQQMLDLLDNHLESTLGGDDVRLERDTFSDADDVQQGGVGFDTITACTRELINSGVLTWLGSQAKISVDESCKERAKVLQPVAQGGEDGEQLRRHTPTWKEWLKFAAGVYKVLLRVVEGLNTQNGKISTLWMEAANDILKGLKRKSKKKESNLALVEYEIFDELVGYGEKVQDGGVAALHVGLMRALLWESERRAEVGQLAGRLGRLVFPSDDLVPHLLLPRVFMGTNEITDYHRRSSSPHGRFLRYLIATCLEYSPSDRFSFAKSVIACLERGSSASMSMAAPDTFGMASRETAINFVIPCMDLAQAIVLQPAPTSKTLTACKDHVEEVKRGIQLSVRILRASMDDTDQVSYLAVLSSQKFVLRFGSRFARVLRKVVPGFAKSCSDVCDDMGPIDMTSDLQSFVQEGIDFVEALRSLSTLLGTAKKFDKEAGTARLDADLLLASLQSCASTPFSTLRHGTLQNSSDSEHSENDDETSGRFFVLRNDDKKRKRNAGEEQPESSSESSDREDSESEADETIVINFKKQRSLLV